MAWPFLFCLLYSLYSVPGGSRSVTWSRLISLVGEGLIPSRAWESRIQISCCRPGWVREGMNPSPTLDFYPFKRQRVRRTRPTYFSLLSSLFCHLSSLFQSSRWFIKFTAQVKHIFIKGGLHLVRQGSKELDHPLVARLGVGRETGDAVFPGRIGQFPDNQGA